MSGAPSAAAPPTGGAVVLSAPGLDDLVRVLRNDDRRVIGPVVRDGVITHDEIQTIDDLPTGWADDQDGGRYRLTETGTPEVFAYSSPSTSWKRYVYPERTLLISARRHNGTIELTEPEHPVHRVAFFGIRSCDLAALGILDRVFLAPDATDPAYRSNRSDVFIVAAGCGHPGRTCFCASMGTGPTPEGGFDLAVTEIYDTDRHEFLVTVGSDRGRTVLGQLTGRAAEPEDHSRAGRIHDDAVAAMSRSLHPDDPPRAARNLDDPRWDDVADRCLACANCTMVCPTCFCGATEDTTDLSGDATERWRVWDSCFTLDFTHLPDGPVRSSTRSRYRQWLLHKLVTWHDQFGTSGCVGCGRCITWCPVGIDLTEEIAALAARQTDLEGGSP